MSEGAPREPIAATLGLTAAHRRRLREVWRSAGWPCQDLLEAELLAAGLLERRLSPTGPDTMRVTDAGVEVLAATLNLNRARLSAHEALVGHVVQDLQRGGRLVWRGLRLRAGLPPDTPAQGEEGKPPGLRWREVIPDVFSIRHTTAEELTVPVVHEIKVRRSDLLADLRRPDKGGAYLALASECWYVLKAGVGNADEIPPPFGVMQEVAGKLDVLRPAPRRPMRVGFAVWMALVRARCEEPPEDSAQQRL